MIILEKVEKLYSDERVKVEFNQVDGLYEIKLKNSDNLYPVVAVVFEDGLVKYFVSNVYNNGVDYAEINIEELRRLHKIIEE